MSSELPAGATTTSQPHTGGYTRRRPAPLTLPVPFPGPTTASRRPHGGPRPSRSTAHAQKKVSLSLPLDAQKTPSARVLPRTPEMCIVPQPDWDPLEMNPAGTFSEASVYFPELGWVAMRSEWPPVQEASGGIGTGGSGRPPKEKAGGLAGALGLREGAQKLAQALKTELGKVTPMLSGKKIVSGPPAQCREGHAACGADAVH
eukprot:RCo043980